MQDVTLVGIDLGKHAFHLHGQDAAGKAVFRRKVSRKQLIEFFATLHPCTVVMEACAGAHCMARKIAELGHEAKLISPQFVRPFVKSNKNDFVDAEAICEAASRPSMRFVTPKTVSRQTLSALHRVRDSLVRDKVCTTNQMHGFLLEFGVTLPVGNAVVRRLPALLAEHSLPPRLVAILERLHAHFKYLSEQISEIEKGLNRQLADDAIAQRLLTIPGVGTITASLLTSELGDGKQYRCGRDFAAAVGLVPRQYSTGGRGEPVGNFQAGGQEHSPVARPVCPCLHAASEQAHRQDGRLGALNARTTTLKRVACALANKFARIAWAIASRDAVFDPCTRSAPR
ncbi:IS110 family transposase [Paraburkholderia youngii]|uniref:IS110 family transposase n=1 Tax=Paraburkholderia youngii TaxID=2782701 RepID=UPI003D1E3F3F